MGWQMYALTGSALDLGLVGLVQFLPATVLILVAGQLADRYDRRRIAQVSQLVEGIAAAALAYGAFTGTTSKELILIGRVLPRRGPRRRSRRPCRRSCRPWCRLRCSRARWRPRRPRSRSPPSPGRRSAACSMRSTRRRSTRSASCMFAAAATQLAFLHYERADDADAGDARRLLRRHRLYAAATASCSASSRSICSRCCSAAPPRCCRSSPRTCSTPGRPGSASCAPRRRSARC